MRISLHDVWEFKSFTIAWQLHVAGHPASAHRTCAIHTALALPLRVDSLSHVLLVLPLPAAQQFSATSVFC